MRESSDIVACLLVEILAVGDDDDAIEKSSTLLQELYQLIGQSSDAIGLPRSCRVLHQIALPYAVGATRSQ